MYLGKSLPKYYGCCSLPKIFIIAHSHNYMQNVLFGGNNTYGTAGIFWPLIKWHYILYTKCSLRENKNEE